MRWLLLAGMYREEKRDAEAESAFLAAVKLSPTLHEAWVLEDVEMANLFSPVRNDYLTQGALEYMKETR